MLGLRLQLYQMYSEIEALLQKPPNHRSKTEIDQLVELTRYLPFFQQQYKLENGHNIHRNCCKAMHLEQYSSNQIVFHIGSQGTKFYIILSGIVKVLIRKKEGEDLEVVRRLRKGESFGEYALINKQPRMATIECATDCQFAVLEKSDFKSILMNEEKNKTEGIVNYFLTVQLFSDQHKNNLRKLCLNSFTYELEKGQSIISDGAIPEFCFLITEGEFIIQKTIKNVMYKVCSVGNQEIIGLYQLINQVPFECDYVCNSIKGMVYKFNRNQFLQKIYDENKENLARNYLTHQSYIKNKLEYDVKNASKFQKPNHKKKSIVINDDEFEYKDVLQLQKSTSPRQKKTLLLLSPRIDLLKQCLEGVSKKRNLPNPHPPTSPTPRQVDLRSPIFSLFMRQYKQFSVERDSKSGRHLFRYNGQGEDVDQFVSINQRGKLSAQLSPNNKPSRSITNQSTIPNTARSIKRILKSRAGDTEVSNQLYVRPYTSLHISPKMKNAILLTKQIAIQKQSDQS